MKKILFLVLVLVFAGCDQGVEPDKQIGRIVIDDNIDGVRLGDDSLAVTQKLGYPNSMVFPATPTVGYVYKEGIHATMSVGIHYRNGVIQISVASPYSGKTKEGIGIGSSRSYVFTKLGSPAESLLQTNGIYDRYFFENSIFMIQYDSVIVQTLELLSKN